MIAGARASTWLDPVRVVLDRSGAGCPIFFRDDDAGWNDARLSALLSIFDRQGIPLDVAVIPTALSESLATDLRARADDGSIRLHQHGYAHLDHEPAGRKHEFGPSRELGVQHADISRGRGLLQDAFGPAADPVFTPPWNRCTAETADALVALGFEVLSRDHTAARFDRPGFHEVSVNVDWFGHRSGARWRRAELAQHLAEAVADTPDVGVMLHHAISDADDRDAIEDLLRLVASHRQAQPTTILQLARLGPAESVGGGVPARAEPDRNL